MDNAGRYLAIERLLGKGDPPSWDELGGTLALPDDRWRRHDPAGSLPGLRESWQAMSPDWDQVRVLWLGIETDDSSSYLDAAGYAHLDGIGFPRREVWHGCSLRSGDLTAFAGYARDQGCYEAYDYGAPLAWTGLVVRLLRPAPAEVPILAGFGDGDWLTFH